MKALHVLVVGATLSGKTFYANQMHRRWPGVSIFCNTNAEPDIWGEHARSTNQALRLIAQGKRHIDLHLPENVDAAVAEVERLRLALFKHGKNASHPVFQVVLDEAHKFDKSDVLHIFASRGRHSGIRLVALTQYPVGVRPETRTNLYHRVFFEPGQEGLEFLQQKGWKEHREGIEAWTDQKYHFCRFDGKNGPFMHKPVSALAHGNQK